MLLVSIIFGFVAGSAAVFVEPGPCPNVTVNKVNLDQISGVWIKHSSSKNEYDYDQDNVELNFLPPKNGVSTVVATSVSNITGDLMKIISQVTINEEDNALYAKFSIPVLGRVDRKFFNVAINCSRYAVSWSCENQGPNHIEAIALYTRERNPPKEVLLEAQRESEKNGVVFSGLMKYE